MLEVTNFLGGLLVIVTSLTGGYIWIRWGLVGVATIWNVRKNIDDIARKEVKETIDANASQHVSDRIEPGTTACGGS